MTNPEESSQPNQDRQIPSGTKRLWRAILRTIKWIIGGAIVLIFSGMAYLQYLANKSLTLRTSHNDWQWQKKSVFRTDTTTTQWRITDKNTYMLRRVYEDQSVYAGLAKNETGGYILFAKATWPAQCEERTEIVTSVTYSSGENVVMRCVKEAWGNQLEVAVGWRDANLTDLPGWDTNYDGFTVNENFGYSWEWDFQPALRHLTIQSAQPSLDEPL